MHDDGDVAVVESIPGLRHVFFKGALPKGAFLLTGPAGSGKTMYCMQFLRDGIAAGERCLYVSFDPLFSKEKFRESLGSQKDDYEESFIAPTTASFFKSGKKDPGRAAALLEQVRRAVDSGAPARVAVDSVTHLLPHFSEGEVLEIVAELASVLRGASAMAIITLTTVPSKGDLSDTIASLLDGTLQIKLEDEGKDLARSLRLLAVRGTYHNPAWARFSITEKGTLMFGQEEQEDDGQAQAEPAITCKLCDKPIAGKVAYDADAPFHPHCLETYRKLSDIYGSSVVYAIPVGVINASFFFIDIVGLSDPSLSVEKQIKKIENLNRLISSCDAVARAPKDKRIILPTGDGMAIGFLMNPELPLQLSMQLHRKLGAFNKSAGAGEAIGVRIGLSAGPVFVVSDINGNQNVWGPGIILARRVMDIGDDRHILLADSLAEQLINLKDEYRRIIKLVSPKFTIKHGQAIKVYSASSADFGNPKVPARLAAG
ncbi:RecA-superfamily ATPase possibly involved in signal transduction [Candidatus Nitrososphaera evergladensis SR1]|jgi:KaiC/GvpD/RAD55 family RecA-like ATPase|uniref:RecA-superfamily ATPase possibly involved in signal transduction n=2 Tax=Nitrososphaera TaxID=497726 RepID=A0A075MVQ0_9ARCH|nr:RecA-superfamily ATPase possibly involved in signal transduction [Candidatus Nitrososphaera evergladensis SR1]